MVFDIDKIFWLEVEYVDIPAESKKRPAIIIGKREESLLILVSTTTQSPSEPPSYFDQFKIPIYNWRKFGFPKPSWALGLRLIEFTESELKSVVKNDDIIGYMNDIDLQHLVNKIEQIHS